MSKTLPLTDASATELLGCAKGTQPVTMSTRLRGEVVAGLDDPVVVPPGNVEAQVRAAAAAAGYTKCIYYAWDWTKTNSIVVQTVNDPQGPLGTNGIVVISFIARPTVAVNGSVSVSEFPGGLGTERKTSIALKPCDYSQPSPWTQIGFNQGIQYTVAPFSQPRVMPTLSVGVQYFLNVANVGTAAQPEMRITASRPALA